jgi:DNA-binding response OmpR family regulator
MRALLRRTEGSRSPILEVADLRLDPVGHRVTRGRDPIELTAKEYTILDAHLVVGGQLITQTPP